MLTSNRNNKSAPQSSRPSIRAAAEPESKDSIMSGRRRANTSLKFEYRPSKLILEQQLVIKQSLYNQLKSSLIDAHSKFTAQHKLLSSFQCLLKKKGFTEKLMAIESANDILRVANSNTDNIQELFGQIYGKISEIFQRKNEDFKNIFERDEKSDLIIEAITSNSIILSECHLEVFNNLKPLEINIVSSLKNSHIVDTEPTDPTSAMVPKKIVVRRSFATQTCPNPTNNPARPKTPPMPLIVDSSTCELLIVPKQLEKDEHSIGTELSLLERRDFGNYVHKATSTMDMCFLLESKAVASENANLVHKNAMLTSLSETQHATIDKLQLLVDKLQEDCKEQRATIAMHQRTLRVRCDVLDSFTSLQSMSPKCCLADLFSDDAQSVKHMQFEISARTEEMSNLFSTLSEKHRCVLKQQQTIEKLQVTNQLHVNRINQLERDVAAMQLEMERNKQRMAAVAGIGVQPAIMGDGPKKEVMGSYFSSHFGQ